MSWTSDLIRWADANDSRFKQIEKQIKALEKRDNAAEPVRAALQESYWSTFGQKPAHPTCGLSGYFTINGGPPHPLLATLTKRYEPKDPPVAPTCGTCRWYSGSGPPRPTPIGVCMRYPPASVPFDERTATSPDSLWPTVAPHLSCGEHSPQCPQERPRCP
jgi:hypothetical protein